MKHLRILSAVFVAIALAGILPAQSSNASSLWRVYLAAGAHASAAGNWPEAEALFTSAAQNAEHLTSSEPYHTIAIYCLATTYWHENRSDDASAALKSLKLILDPSLVHPDLYQSADVLNSLGTTFFNLAEAETKDAKDKKLAGEALTKANSDANQDYHFSRRLYQWAFVIDKQFMPPLSPELEDIASGLSLSTYDAEEYADALPVLKELFGIVETANQRDTALAKGSMAYSLAAKGSTGTVTQLLSPAAVTLFIGLSGEAVGNGVTKDTPADAIHQYADIEPYLTKYMNDSKYGPNLRIVLKRVYGEHAEALRRLHQEAQAERYETLEKALPSPNQSARTGSQ